MYMHAYQSYVWNHAASKRWALHGNRVVEGDLVIDDAAGVSSLASGVDGDDDDTVIHVAPAADDEDAPLQARPLTAADAAAGKYSIHDVVLPTPGYEVIYPTGEMGAFYKEFMGRDENGGLDPHAMRRPQREFSLPGRYRKLMARFLTRPSFEVRTYADDNEQMHPTDLDIIMEKEKKNIRAKQEEKDAKQETEQGQPGQKRGLEADDQEPADESSAKKARLDTGTEEQNIDMARVDEPVVSGNGLAAAVASDGADEAGKGDSCGVTPEKVAVVLKFQLAKSAYATVVLRELMGVVPEDVALEAKKDMAKG
jgi:tRNA pseudouridine13 synthase